YRPTGGAIVEFLNSLDQGRRGPFRSATAAPDADEVGVFIWCPAQSVSVLLDSDLRMSRTGRIGSRRSCPNPRFSGHMSTVDTYVSPMPTCGQIMFVVGSLVRHAFPSPNHSCGKRINYCRGSCKSCLGRRRSFRIIRSS